MSNQIKPDEIELPECPECDDNSQVRDIGVIEYGADYDDAEWYEKCEWRNGYYCDDCEITFVGEIVE